MTTIQTTTGADIRIVDVKDPKPYVELNRITDEFTFCASSSGKAVLLQNPKHQGEFWCPLSILRRKADHQSAQYGDALLIPVWFLQKNRISY